MTLHWLRDRRIRRDLAEAAEVAVVSEWLGQVMASLAAPAQTRTPPTMFAGPTEVVVEVADTTAPEERVGAAELVWFSRGDGGSTQSWATPSACTRQGGVRPAGGATRRRVTGTLLGATRPAASRCRPGACPDDGHPGEPSGGLAADGAL